MAHQRTRSIIHAGAASGAELPRYAEWEHASSESTGERLSASSAAHGASLVLDLGTGLLSGEFFSGHPQRSSRWPPACTAWMTVSRKVPGRLASGWSAHGHPPSITSRPIPMVSANLAIQKLTIGQGRPRWWTVGALCERILTPERRYAGYASRQYGRSAGLAFAPGMSKAA